MTQQIAPRTIDVFRPGTFKPMAGDAITFSAADLKALAEAYDVSAPAPAVVGHPKTDDPAFAWAKAFAFDEARQVLTAEIDEIDPAFAEAVQAGRYKKISLELFTPGSPNNPRPGSYYPKHIGFLGAAAPAVSGLRPVAFAEGGEGVVTFTGAFSEPVPALKDVAGLFRALRELIIEKFGAEAADKAVPNWSINWIADQADPEKPLPFSEPEIQTMNDKTVDQAALAQREQELAAREQAIAAREQQARRAESLSFAEGLIAEGKLLPVLKDKAVALLDALGAGQATVSFAEGDKTVESAPAQLFKDILAASPKVVTFGAMDRGADPEGLSFADPGTVAAAAVAFQSEQAAKGVQITTAEAVDHVSKGNGK